MTGPFFGPVIVYNYLIIWSYSVMTSRLQPVDIKALPPAHRAIFQAQQAAFEQQQEANDELRATVELLTDTNRRLEHLIGELRRAIYDKKSEKRPLDDRQLAFEDLEGAVAEAEEAAAAPGNAVADISALGEVSGLLWLWLGPATSPGMEAWAVPAGRGAAPLWIERVPAQ